LLTLDPGQVFALMVKKLVDAQDSADHQSSVILKEKIVASSYLKELISACKKIEDCYESFLSSLDEICTEEGQKSGVENELSESTLNEYGKLADYILQHHFMF
jgi:hypothetical protein